MHAAVIAINEAIEKGAAEQTILTLRNPNAVLTLVDEKLAQEYQKELWEAKKGKEENAKLKNNCISEEERAEDRTLGYVTIWGSKTSRETEFSQMEKEKSDDSKKEKDRQSGTKK